MITYDNDDLSDIICVTKFHFPVLPPQSVDSVAIIDRIGSVFTYKQDGGADIGVDFSIEGERPCAPGSQPYLAAVRELAGRLWKEEPKRLDFADFPGWYLTGIVSGTTNLDTVVRWGSGRLTFHCDDPCWYADPDDVFTYNSTGSKNFIRKGNAPALPLFEITGTSGSSGEISLSLGGRKITYTGELVSGDTLVIDCKWATAYIENGGVRTSVIDNLDSLDFPISSPGSNTLVISTQGGATIGSVRIENRSRSV